MIKKRDEGNQQNQPESGKDTSSNGNKGQTGKAIEEGKKNDFLRK